MKQLGLGRKAFAAHFGITARRLDNWLLPEDSKGFRPMNLDFQEKVFGALRDKEIAESFKLTAGTYDSSVKAIRCNTFSFNFPTLYMITSDIQGVNIQSGEPDLSVNEIFYSYVLCQNPKPTASNETIRRCVPVVNRTGKEHSGWVFITEHRSLDRAEAYLFCVHCSQPEHVSFSVHLYEFDGHIFSIYRMDKPHGEKVLDCVTFYSSDLYLDRIVPLGIEKMAHVAENNWSLILDKTGNEINSDIAYGEE